MKKKITKEEAIELSKKIGVNFNKDYHAQNIPSEFGAIIKLAGYRKSASSPKSTYRAFFDHLRKSINK